MRRSYRDVPTRAIELYQKGVPLAEVGRQVGFSSPAVAKFLRSHGVPILAKGQKHGPQPEREELQALRDQGLSAREIGEHYGRSDEWARERLASFEIPRLPGKARPEHNYFWSGGRTTDKTGYVLARMNRHPHASRTGYVREHRLVMEAQLGRLLDPREVVDHCNGIVDDNRPENLVLYSTNADHLRGTLTGRPQRSRALRRSRPDGPTLTAKETGADRSRLSHPLGPWPPGTTVPGLSGMLDQPVPARPSRPRSMT